MGSPGCRCGGAVGVIALRRGGAAASRRKARALVQDIGVLEGSQRVSDAEEPPGGRRPCARVGDVQRDGPIERALGRAVDAHKPVGAHEGLDEVGPEAGAAVEWRAYRHSHKRIQAA